MKKEKVEKKQKLPPWEFINLMAQGKNFDDILDKEQYSPFFIHRLVSSTDLYRSLMNEINLYSSIPKKISYKYVQSVLPKRKLFFKSEVSVAKRVDKMNLAIQDYFSCGTRDAQSHLEILPQEVQDKILDSYFIKIGEK